MAGQNARDCFISEIILGAGYVVQGMPAAGQMLPIIQYQELFALIGYAFGGSGASFALPDLRGAAPNGLTYTICTQGLFPSMQ